MPRRRAAPVEPAAEKPPPAWKHAMTGYVPERNAKGNVVPLTAEHRAARAVQPGERGPVGRKSGRVAPLRQLRQPAREATLVQHGLMEAGTGDVNQGQLFSTEQYQEPITETAKRFGVTPPMASSRCRYCALFVLDSGKSQERLIDHRVKRCMR